MCRRRVCEWAAFSQVLFFGVNAANGNFSGKEVWMNRNRSGLVVGVLMGLIILLAHYGGHEPLLVWATILLVAEMRPWDK